MARSVTIGNGRILVGLDHLGQVRDFYYPNVGHSNHVSGASGNYMHRVGVFVDGTLSWFNETDWSVSVHSADDAPVGVLSAVNPALRVTITSTDVVHNEDNIFLRSFTVTNDASEKREIKVFFSQQFRINESRRGDTGFFDPRVGAIIHYKGHTKFLVNAYVNGKQFTEYNIGLFGIEGKEGTYHDADDGVLEKNPVEHGSVDSVLGVSLVLASKKTETIHYWIVCGPTIDAVHDLNTLVLEKTPEALIGTTRSYWSAWMTKEERDLSPLSEELQALFRRSLAVIRVHTDNGGAIIASSDTDMLHHGRDTYSYVWPRDGALIAHSLDVTGYADVAERYYTFMTGLLERGGYLLHKYRSDGVVGSSWHPWVISGSPILPIQEDETALTLIMLWKHYTISKDVEYLESRYDSFIEPAADFMIEHIEPTLGLPSPSYDLWEEKYGVHTYTASAVYSALMTSAQCASLLGKVERARTYTVVAERMKQAIMDVLYSEELGMFIKQVSVTDGEVTAIDTTIDMSSFFGPIYFGVIDVDDERVITSARTVEERLRVTGASDGYVRYTDDAYYTLHDAGSPNPWIITTLWIAQYHIMKATSVDDLTRAYEILEWTCSHATEAGVLAEQMHPHTRAHLSTAPLVWSHAEYVITCDAYLTKYHALTAKDEVE